MKWPTTWEGQRDMLIVFAAIALMTFEVTVGGGRATVMTACTSLLLSPVFLHMDEARRKRNADDDPKEGSP